MALPDDLWRECAAWLTRCKIIPADHRLNTIFDFFRLDDFFLEIPEQIGAHPRLKFWH